MTEPVTTHTCPRRMNEGPWERVENLDTYTTRHGMIGRGCSFCGSMEPTDFLTAVKTGAEIGPTDKSYKLYVHIPNPQPGDIWYLAWDDEMTAEQLEAAHYDRDVFPFIGFGHRLTLDAKFYTVHFSPEQGREFVALWQAGKVHWGYPGHPYVRLYVPGFGRDDAKEQVT